MLRPAALEMGLLLMVMKVFTREDSAFEGWLRRIRLMGLIEDEDLLMFFCNLAAPFSKYYDEKFVCQEYRADKRCRYRSETL